MADGVTIDGKEYVPSKKASELSGYAQDYIGQLARGGFVDAKRVSGLWYVQMSSLLGYKQTAETKVREAPVRTPDAQPEALVFFDGKEYVSASKAAEISGYNPDYIGQLSRSGAIVSRQVGSRWYVERDSLISHKTEKDSLLAAVQTDSVGIQRPANAASEKYAKTLNTLPRINYLPDDRELFPRVKTAVPQIHISPNTSRIEDAPSAPIISKETETRVPILTQSQPSPMLDLEKRPRIPMNDTFAPTPRIRRYKEVRDAEERIEEPLKKNSRERSFSPAILVLAILVPIVIGGIIFYLPNLKQGGTSDATAAAAQSLGVVGDAVETVVSPELTYYRQQ